MSKAASQRHQPHVPTALQRAEAELLGAIRAEQDGGQPPAPPEVQPGEPSPESAEELPAMPPENATGQPPSAPPTVVDAQGLTPEHFGTPVEAPAATPTPAPAGEDAAAWRQRYEVLKGKYDAEVPRLQQSLRLLEALLEQQQARGPAAAASAAAAPGEPEGAQPAAEDLTDEALRKLVDDPRLLEEFGPEFFRTLVKVTRKLSPPAPTGADRELRAELVQVRRDRLEAGLDRLLPNWRRQDADPRFVEWMHGTVEPRTGLRYVDVLRGAMQRSDLQGVAAVFRDWPGAVAASAPGQAPRVPVAQQVTVRPAGGAGAPPKPAPQKREYTQAEVMKAAKAIATGEIGGERAKALRADLDAALAEGRVTH